jgi:cytosine/adenosine deaminase-related metal-dependent hydrolase
MAASALSAVRGRIVTMDARGTMIPDGIVYVRDGLIAAVTAATDAVPDGFDGIEPLATGGTIYPGLIELHNHLSYNCLQLWQVPHVFQNRGQWSDSTSNPDYRKLISGPMQVIGKSPDIVPSLIRYVEAKCLLAGVTTTQGIALSSDPGISKFYKGVVRNTDDPDSALLARAPARIPDVAAGDSQRFADELARDHRLLLHLAEGVGDTAHSYFEDLKLPDGTWAITDHLIAIHSVALQPADIEVVKANGASMVWSPLSNLLLYEETADIAEFHRQGVLIGLGSDWSPSGSKNLLGELKVAYQYSRHQPGGPVFTCQELVGMVTRDAATILDWDAALGSIEAGKLADLVAIDSASPRYYQALVNATERDVILVMIGGTVCAGRPDLLPVGEPVSVGGQIRHLNFDTPGADPTVKPVTLAQATATLTQALHDLPDLAGGLDAHVAHPDGMTLSLDEIEPTGHTFRMQPKNGFRSPTMRMLAAQPPLSEVLEPLVLDGLTAVDDATYFETLAGEIDLPDYLAPSLAAAYGHGS